MLGTPVNKSTTFFGRRPLFELIFYLLTCRHNTDFEAEDSEISEDELKHPDPKHTSSVGGEEELEFPLKIHKENFF